MAASIAMMAITTSSSISVKPGRPPRDVQSLCVRSGVMVPLLLFLEGSRSGPSVRALRPPDGATDRPDRRLEPRELDVSQDVDSVPAVADVDPGTAEER